MPYFVMNPPPGLDALFAAEEWTTLRPGVLQKEVTFHGVVLRSRVMRCQDCEDDDAMLSAPILTDDLWRQLFPNNGVACGPCILKRLERPLRKSDLKPTAKGNYGLLQDLEP